MSVKRKRILLVEDDEKNRKIVTRILHNHNVDIIEADNGASALKIINNEEPFDLILMDLMMPIMDGLETTINIRKLEQYKNTPLIVVSAKAMSSDRIKSIEAGASDYLAKPFNIHDFLQIINKWIEI